MRIIVIGAGIGGLAVAAGLQRAGARVTVYERAGAPSPVGAGLSIFGNGMRALDAIGRGDAVRAVTAPPDPGLQAGQRTPDGSWLSRLPADAASELRVVHRADLHAALEAGLAPGTVEYGREVESASLLESTEQADLVIAADGVRSPVRAALWPDDPGLRYAGYSAWRGVTAHPVDLGHAAGETWGRGLRFGIAPLVDGRVYWFGVATLPEGTRYPDEHAEVLRRFGDWHEPIAELVAATEPGAVLHHDVHDLARPLSTFVRGRVALLGDSAHAMTPDLGQGGNQALEDAATLVALLTGGTDGHVDADIDIDIDAALAEYDALRRPRTRSIARTARTLGAVAHVPTAFGAWARDLLLRLTPDAVLGRQAERVQAWEPPRWSTRRPIPSRMSPSAPDVRPVSPRR